MNYLLKGIKKQDIIDTIMENRGISSMELLLNPTRSNNTNVENLKNLKLGIEIIKEKIKIGKIMLLVDSDVDGFTSGSIMYKSLIKLNEFADIEYYIHPEKKHGLTEDFMKIIEEMHEKPNLIIVPDAGSNDVDEIEILEKMGIDVLIIDHHEISKESNYGIIINNQNEENINVNKNLTGAGLTYLFCKELLKEVTFEEEDFNIDILNLAMLGQVADSSDLIENEVRNLCMESLELIKNNQMMVSYNVLQKDLNELTIKDLSFSGIIPLINSVTRVGTKEERTLVFEGLADIKVFRTWLVERRKLNKETRKYEKIMFDYNLYEYVHYICEQCVAKQNKITNKLFKEFVEKFNEELEVQVFVGEKREELKGISGLLANKLSDEFNKPTIIVSKNANGLLTGSMRGNENVMPDFREWCLNTGLFNLVEGHANAAGVEIKEENLNKLIDEIKTITPTGKITYVDAIYNRIPTDEIGVVLKYENLWKNGVDEPVFAFENISVPTCLIQWSKNTMRINVNGITFIKFKTPEEEVNLMKEKETLKFNAIGTFNKNEWNGNTYMQIKISELEEIEQLERVVSFGIFG